MKKILIFGSKGGLGMKLCQLLRHQDITNIKKSKINFLNKNSKTKIDKLLKKLNPEIIINCAGVLGTNSQDYKKVFDVNFGSNWDIIRYYLSQNNKKLKKLVLIGSSGFKLPKPDYMLYSASKNALQNLFMSSKNVLKKKGINVYIFHPSRMDTKMVSNLKYRSKTKKISPSKVAHKIISSCKI